MRVRNAYACLTVFIAAVPPLLADVDFRRDVLPILADRCFRCHGPDDAANEGSLRLDRREFAIATRRDGARAIFPERSADSILLQRVSAADPDVRMPPPNAGEALTVAEIDTLRRWIDGGAEYASHWSFTPPEDPEVPDLGEAAAWSRVSFDAFVAGRLRSSGLDPAVEEEPGVLARRVALDLTGLPPTIEAIDRFLADERPDAFERWVDQQLASPAYGERWARVWLDLARYADSAGYAQDPPRTIWRYRDWVVGALNAGMPFDQFTVEQLAGDMLPEPTDEQLIATAFHRNTMTNSEGGTDDEEFRTAAVVDRVNTTMQVWMGLTMGCAQCHTHKYDPITQKEYFQVFAIFNNTADADRGDESPTLMTLSPAGEVRRESLRRELATAEKALADKVVELERDGGGVPSGTDAPSVDGASAEGASSVDQRPLQTRFVRVEHLREKAFLSLAEVQVFVGARNVAPDGKASQSSVAFDGPAKLAIDGDTTGEYAAKSTTHTSMNDPAPWWEVDLGSTHAVDRVVLWNRTDGVGSRLDRFRVVGLDGERRPVWLHRLETVPDPNILLEVPKYRDLLSEADRGELEAYSRDHSPELQGLRSKVADLKKRIDGIKGVTTPILRELPEGKRRTTHVQIRGNFRERGEKVSAAVLGAFHPLPPEKKPTRLAFAEWLLDRGNPLTARVLANRYWEQLFGHGIVRTSEDFGVQGEPPSHPELLDHLARQLQHDGWDTKRFVLRIASSGTYRQSSRVREVARSVDPANNLLSRGPRFRLSAEMLRDQALAVAGLLSRKLHGPSVRPPRPKLGLRAAFGGSTDWATSPGEDRYRRGLYTSWRRTTPYPSLMTFDAPSREVCTVRRIRTNTPLQALVTLNDPAFVEAAQALARRLVREGGSTVEDRCRYGFRLTLARRPTEEELRQMVALFTEAQSRYRKAPAEAEQLATEPLGPVPEGWDAVELAAWTLVSNVLLNLDEFIARR